MNKYSYITLLSDDSYVYGVILLNETLKRTNAQYPLIVLVTPNVTKPILNILKQLNLQYKIIAPLYNNKIIQFNRQANPSMAKIWYYCLSKFEIFNMTDYDKLLFLDADIMVLKNLDHLFKCSHMTSALDGEYFDLWPDWPHFNSGIMIIEPNKEEYKKIVNFAINDAINQWTEPTCIADQEILNMYYKDWINKPELHLDKYYDIFGPYIQEEQIADVDKNCYFIHFVGRKPWRAFMKNPMETYTEKYYVDAHNIIQEVVNTLDWARAKKEIKLTIYSICKNEIANIDRFLKCFSKADYICILDTGSTDGTWEFLQQAQYNYSNLIIDQKIISPWRYDVARNTSLELVPKDTTMYFMMDLDEIIKEEDWLEKIKNAWNPLFSRGQYRYNRSVDPKTDIPIQYFSEHRIHNDTWRYHGIVHEQLYNIGGEREFFADECIQVPIVVWHYPTKRDKSSYVELCQRALKEEPNNWLMRMQLAAEYEVNNQPENAIKAYQEIIDAPITTLELIEIGRCYASLGRILGQQGKTEEALKVLESGRERVPYCGDNYFMAAEILYYKERYEEAFNFCEAGLKNSMANQWCSIVDKNGYYPYLIMGLCKVFIGQPILGLGYLSIAREKNNTEENNRIYYSVYNEIMKGR